MVSDQIRLWQQETRRIKTAPAVLYHRFESLQLYNKIAEFAHRMGVLLYKHDDAQQLVVHSDSHDLVRAEIKALKAEFAL